MSPREGSSLKKMNFIFVISGGHGPQMVGSAASHFYARESRTTVQGGCDGTSVDVERWFDSTSWHQSMTIQPAELVTQKRQGLAAATLNQYIAGREAMRE